MGGADGKAGKKQIKVQETGKDQTQKPKEKNIIELALWNSYPKQSISVLTTKHPHKSWDKYCEAISDHLAKHTNTSKNIHPYILCHLYI